MTSSDVHVAVAIVINQCNQALISLRPDSLHQGGLWEFPGGKIEAGESVAGALERELLEELNIHVLESRPFKTLRHQYPDKTVVLNIQIVSAFSGVPMGAEGQKIKWLAIDQLKTIEFPAANRSVIHALNFPDKYMITGPFDNMDSFLSRLNSSLQNGIKLVQLRCKNVGVNDFLAIAEQAKIICDQFNASLLLNTSDDIFQQTQAHGLHLSSYQLHQTTARPVGYEKLLSVSCHNSKDIQHATKINADIILLSPVKETTSHPGVKGIGWNAFSDLVSKVHIPVYALGGMSECDIPDAKKSGAQGVAAISSFWK